jgi:hypothetical protein
MTRHVKLLLTVSLVACLLAGTGLARATETLLDEELDRVSASGDFSLELGEGPNGIPSVNFSFATGGTVGNGSVLISPTGTPSSVITGGVNFSNTLFNVENMIFNLNICVQCQATTLTQGNLGVPITVKLVP